MALSIVKLSTNIIHHVIVFFNISYSEIPGNIAARGQNDMSLELIVCYYSLLTHVIR